jgi:hypothetical protein
VISTTGTTVSACASASKRPAKKASPGTLRSARVSVTARQKLAALEISASMRIAAAAKSVHLKTAVTSLNSSGTQMPANANACPLTAFSPLYGIQIIANALQHA